MPPPLASLARKAFTITRSNVDFSGTLGQIDHRTALLKLDEEGALRLAAAWIANTLIADEAASLPVKLVRRADTTRSPVRPRELRALWDAPNNDGPMEEFTASRSLSLTLWGAEYTYLGWTNAGNLDAMWLQEPERCRVERVDERTLRLKVAGRGDLVNRPGAKPEFRLTTLYRLPGDLVPLSPVQYASQLLGLSDAYDGVAAGMMARGINPTVVVTAGEKITPENAKEMAEALMHQHGGPKQAGKPAVFGGKDIKVERLTMSMADAQFIQQHDRVFALVMALWRVPPTVAGMVDKPSTWGTGVDAFARGLERFTLRPIVLRLNAADEFYCTRWVDPEIQVKRPFDAMLSATPKDRTDIQARRLQAGMTSVERVLAQEDEPPFDEDETVYSQLSLATEEDRELRRALQRARIEALQAGMTSVERVLAQEDEPPFDEDETVSSQLSMATEEDRELRRALQRARIEAATPSPPAA